MTKRSHEWYEQRLLDIEAKAFPVEKYIGSREKILHECIEGHQWLVTPNTIMSGSNCPECSGVVKLNTESYIDKLLAREIYTIPIESYINTDTSILHECIEGHQYFTRPNRLLSGRQCPFCVKYGINYNAKAILYFLKVENVYKVGITTSTVKKRHSKDLDKIEILWIIPFNTAKQAHKIEKTLLRLNKEFKFTGKLLNSGNTELITRYIEKEEAILIASSLGVMEKQ